MRDQDIKEGVEVICVYQGMPEVYGQRATIVSIARGGTGRIFDYGVKWHHNSSSHLHWGRAESFALPNELSAEQLKDLERHADQAKRLAYAMKYL